jgi:hypothetical protein
MLAEGGQIVDEMVVGGADRHHRTSRDRNRPDTLAGRGGARRGSRRDHTCRPAVLPEGIELQEIYPISSDEAAAMDEDCAQINLIYGPPFDPEMLDRGDGDRPVGDIRPLTGSRGLQLR